MLRLGATISGESINWSTDPIYIALMANGYVQDVTSAHWSDIVASEVTPTGNYVTGGIQLTTVAPYMETALYPPFRYVVCTANAGSTPAYSVEWQNQTFTNIAGAAVYKKGATAATSPLLVFIAGLTVTTANGDNFFIQFGTPGSSLGIFHRQLF